MRIAFVVFVALVIAMLVVVWVVRSPAAEKETQDKLAQISAGVPAFYAGIRDRWARFRKAAEDRLAKK